MPPHAAISGGQAAGLRPLRASLQDDPNPFALVTLAHLQTRATRNDPQARYEAKWRLIKILLGRGWSKSSIIGLLRVIDWMMHLPEHFKQQLWKNLQQLATEKHMTYVTSFEQICIDKGMQAGMEAGRQEGRQQGESDLLKRLLSRRFGLSSTNAQTRLDNATLEQLEQWAENILDAKTLEDVFKHH